jgi:tRNA 2-thiouridine synthesizing protein A
MTNDPIRIDARGMKCPWPALRAAKAMREASRVEIVTDDPRAAQELGALASAGDWTFAPVSDPTGPCFRLERPEIRPLSL